MARELKMSREDHYRLLGHVAARSPVFDESCARGRQQGARRPLADPNVPDLESRLEDDQTREVMLR